MKKHTLKTGWQTQTHSYVCNVIAVNWNSFVQMESGTCEFPKDATFSIQWFLFSERNKKNTPVESMIRRTKPEMNCMEKLKTIHWDTHRGRERERHNHWCYVMMYYEYFYPLHFPFTSAFVTVRFPFSQNSSSKNIFFCLDKYLSTIPRAKAAKSFQFMHQMISTSKYRK